VSNTSTQSRPEIRTEQTTSRAIRAIHPFIAPTGFREYDARWKFDADINLSGVRCVGAAFGTMLLENCHEPPKVIVAHDYRSYSEAVKSAFIVGLISAGAHVLDMGLATTPMAYFARFVTGADALAMITASHNGNPWTGVKLGEKHPLTYGPEKMAQLREVTLQHTYASGAGRYDALNSIYDQYISHISARISLTRRLRVVVAAGNGTPGAFAPRALQAIGCDVIERHCNLDWDFPHYNPDPEDMRGMSDLADVVRAERADVGFFFDGDGDRLGVVDDHGEILLSDKLGVLLARSIAQSRPGSHFVVDVKSTSLFATDHVLAQHKATVEYWKTGHSHIKSRLFSQNAMAAFEKSGHFFFSGDLGLGYDDATLSAAYVAQLITASKTPLSKLRETLARTWQSSTRAVTCPDEQKYDAAGAVCRYYESLLKAEENVCGHRISELNRVNGVRVILDDGSWGLVRASSNKPSLVVVAESPTSPEMVASISAHLDEAIRSSGYDIGTYDQGLVIL
jgi:phosphomannomutase/phosphoglucomutase